MSSKIHCEGCGARVPASKGPSHRSIGSSSGCWEVYGQVLSRDYGELGMPPEHRLVVDAYAAQHPGSESLQSTRSVTVHLIALHLAIERGTPLERITGALRHDAKRSEYRWLPPPENLGAITVVDAHAAQDRMRLAEVCTEWATSVWSAWSDFHGTVRGWVSR